MDEMKKLKLFLVVAFYALLCNKQMCGMPTKKLSNHNSLKELTGYNEHSIQLALSTLESILDNDSKIIQENLIKKTKNELLKIISQKTNSIIKDEEMNTAIFFVKNEIKLTPVPKATALLQKDVKPLTIKEKAALFQKHTEILTIKKRITELKENTLTLKSAQKYNVKNTYYMDQKIQDRIQKKIIPIIHKALKKQGVIIKKRKNVAAYKTPKLLPEGINGMSTNKYILNAIHFKNDNPKIDILYHETVHQILGHSSIPNNNTSTILKKETTASEVTVLSMGESYLSKNIKLSKITDYLSHLIPINPKDLIPRKNFININCYHLDGAIKGISKLPKKILLEIQKTLN